MIEKILEIISDDIRSESVSDIPITTPHIKIIMPSPMPIEPWVNILIPIRERPGNEPIMQLVVVCRIEGEEL